MDKIIHKHLNNRLDLQESASKTSAALLGSVDLNAVLEAPEAELARVIQQTMFVVEEYAPDAAKEGLRFANEAKERHSKDKPIVYQDSQDPKLNEGQL